MYTKLLLTFAVFCFISEISGQGFIPPFRPVPAQRRQFLTPVQQTHILSDIQQHQHRFNLNPFAQQQSQPPPQNTFNQQFQQKNLRPQQSPQFQQIPALSAQLPQQVQRVSFQQNVIPQPSQNNFRTAFPQQNFQHHTQTTFIPNFNPGAAPPQQQNRLSQRTVGNQLQQPQFPFNGHQQHQHQPQQQGFNQLPLSPNTQSNVLTEQFPPLTNSAPQFRFPNQPVVNQQFRQQASQAPFIASQPLPVANPPPFTSINQQVQPFPQPQAQAQVQPQSLQKQQQQQQQQNSFVIQPSLGNQVETVITETRLHSPPQNTFVSQASLQSQKQFLQPNNNFEPPFNAHNEREKQRLIQKHEEFHLKQYQKELARAEELHKEFLRKQQSIKQKHQELQSKAQPVFPTNKNRNVPLAELNNFEQALRQYELEHPTSPRSTTTATITQAPTTTRSKPSKSKKNEIIIDDPAQLQLLLQGQQDKLFSLLQQDKDASVSKSKSKVKSTKALGKEDILRQLKLALAKQPQDFGNNNVTTMDLVLPDGQKVQVIRTSDPELIKRAGVDPSRVITEEAPLPKEPISLDDIRKNLPPGADFEIVRKTADGREEVVKLPPKKKVTFVYLEEQQDGSYKVQGVKSDKDKEVKQSGPDVDSILKRIKNGEIKLPPPTQEEEEENRSQTPSPIRISSFASSLSPSTLSPYSTVPLEVSNKISRSPSSIVSTDATHSSSRYTFEATASTASPYSTLSTSHTQNTARSRPRTTATPQTTTRQTPTLTTSGFTDSDNIFDPLPSETSEVSTSLNEMSNILKNNGLHAMAKYLKQSGLDTILNETGPYTVFAPTDKAFKSLLVQLGGPDKAEEKFRNNPRLLSGLLLHHVIPGSFEIASLQDEMTGVSLAGTQLRVNQYTMQDQEWNDVTVTTINGAMVTSDKQDIAIPQGIAHAIDRVMFPLPVGDVLQTLQSDRERRFGHFLRALQTSGMSDTLQNKGVKTYTVFAPSDAAFASMSDDELTKIGSDKEAAEKFVKKHVVPGTLFTAGMRFYQVKESMAEGQSVTLQKNGGKIRVNDSTMVSSNIPATNGVIHAIDNLL